MIKELHHITRKFIAGLLALVLLVSFVFVQPVIAQSSEDAKDAVCAGLGAVTGTDGCESSVDDADVDDTLQTVVNLLSFVGAVIAVIMIIVGGIRYVTSSGDSNSTASARNTVIYALIGLVIIALAQLLVRFTATSINDPVDTSSGGTSDSIPSDPPDAPGTGSSGIR